MNNLYIPDIPSNFRYISVIGFYVSFLIPFLSGTMKKMTMVYVFSITICGLLREMYFLTYDIEKMLVYYVLPLTITLGFYEKIQSELTVLLYVPFIIYFFVMKFLNINMTKLYIDYLFLTPLFLACLTIFYLLT